MREITDKRELQEIELEIFDAIHAFCEKRGLRYSLYGGTLIGAIRHKGFIPWDDDIDLIMPRPDYEVFCREFKADGFSVHDHRNDTEYVYRFLCMTTETILSMCIRLRRFTMKELFFLKIVFRKLGQVFMSIYFPWMAFRITGKACLRPNGLGA